MSERELDNAMLMGKILSKLEAIEEKLENFTGELCKLKERVTTLEQWRYKVIGGAVALSTIASLLVKYLT